MNEKQKQIINHSSIQRSIDEQNQKTDSNCQRVIPISINYLPSTRIISTNRRRSPKINQQSEPYANAEHFLYNQNSLPKIKTSQKRSRQNDYFIHEVDQHINKRVRYEQSNSIELENQPPRTIIKQENNFFNSTEENFPNLSIENLNTLSNFNHLLPSLSTYHRMNNNNTSNNEYGQNLSNHYSHCHHLPVNHLNDQYFYTLGNDSLRNSSQKNSKSSMNIVKNNLCLLSSPQPNLNSPLRTTNFIHDTKNSTIIRTGNISPAHSDTSTESTSTCSSDEQQFHQNFSLFHYQPSRSYRERENYEQLIDLAEKLSDPNRFNKVDIEQFFSYRYKTNPTIDILSSKQTACVICMSHFKSGQRIRVLPCQHEYHSKCIARWFTMNSSCPICRRDNFLSTC